MLVGKEIIGWKKNISWRISPAQNGNVRTFPGMQDRKTAVAGNNAPRPYRGGGGGKLSVGKFFFLVGWAQKMSVGKKMPAAGNANLLVRRSVRK